MRIHLAFLSIALLAGCDDDNNNNNHDEDQQRALDDGEARGSDLSAQARSQFSGASDSDTLARAAAIVATLDMGEIDQANFVVSTIDAGATTGNDEDVRDLAQQIITDHQANLAKLQTLLDDRGIAQADNQVAATLRTEAMTGLAQLQADSRSDLDLDYTRMQVMMHQEGFVLVGTLRDLVRDDAFRSFLSDTQDAIEGHREHARDVLNDL